MARCVVDRAVTPPPILPCPSSGTPVRLICVNALDKIKRTTSTESQGCSVEFKRYYSTESNYSVESLQSSCSSTSSKGYFSQHSDMGSINENTDYGSGMRVQPDSAPSRVQPDSAPSRVQSDSSAPSRVQSDSAPSAKLDYTNKGGSLVEFNESGALALAPSSGPQDPSSLYSLYRYKSYNIPYDDGGEVILLRSQQYPRLFLTGHREVGPNEDMVDARASFSPPNNEWPTKDSYWRPVTYKEAFQGTRLYDESLVGRGYFILQHWPLAKDKLPPSAPDLKTRLYFVIHYTHDNQWNYLLGSWDSAFCQGLFAFQ